MKIPIKIDPCPIAEAIIEVRFEANVPPNAVFGILYKSFQSEFSDFTSLPILQLPEDIRSSDPQLKYKPYYKASKGNFHIQIGPDVVSYSNSKTYAGWNVFSKKVIDMVEKFSQSEIVKSINRVGVRYINFFKDIDIYDSIKLSINLNNNPFETKQSVLRSTLQTGDFLTNLNIANKAVISGSENKINNGSIIDIDTFIVNTNKLTLSDLPTLIEKGHSEEKQLFFKLLTEDFIKSLNPQY